MKKNTLLVIVIIGVLAVAVIGIVVYSGLMKKNPTEVTKGTENTIEVKGQKNVSIENFTYSPKELTILKGETVVWTNKDSVKHNVASDSGNELVSELFGKGGTYSHTFNQVGEYAYHCTPHPFMTGKIVVQ